MIIRSLTRAALYLAFFEAASALTSITAPHFHRLEARAETEEVQEKSSSLTPVDSASTATGQTADQNDDEPPPEDVPDVTIDRRQLLNIGALFALNAAGFRITENKECGNEPAKEDAQTKKWNAVESILDLWTEGVGSALKQARGQPIDFWPRLKSQLRFIYRAIVESLLPNKKIYSMRLGQRICHYQRDRTSQGIFGNSNLLIGVLPVEKGLFDDRISYSLILDMFKDYTEKKIKNRVLDEKVSRRFVLSPLLKFMKNDYDKATKDCDNTPVVLRIKRLDKDPDDEEDVGNKLEVTILSPWLKGETTLKIAETEMPKGFRAYDYSVGFYVLLRSVATEILFPDSKL